jgi:hypothetical protein
VIGLLLHVSGLVDRRIPMSAADAVGLIDPASLRTLVAREQRTPCRLAPEDLAWLRS